MPLPARETPTLVTAAPVPALAATPREIPVKPVAANPPVAAVAPAAKEVTTSKPEERAPAVASDTAKDAGVMSMAELPPTIQQELPKLAVLAHSYSSKPKARFVFINDRMVHEEEFPAAGLKLEQITPDGMIFSYKGYRFRRNANQ